MSSHKYRKEKDCLNCGHEVEEHFCPHCGQENIELKEDALHMISHAIADYFHFESKFFGTLIPLLFKPGILTKQYVAGKRASFIHPIRLYIFISIVFFIVTLSPSHEPQVAVQATTGSKTEAKNATVKGSLNSEETQKLKKTLKLLPIPESEKESLINEIVADTAAQKELKNTTKQNSLSSKSSWFNANDATIADYEKRQLSLPKGERDNLVQNYLNKKSIKMKSYPDADERIEKQILQNVPKLMFLLLPLFALILKLVYWRKKKFYYEHLIYSFHIHSALFLSVLITIFLQWLFGFFYEVSTILTLLCLIYITWYVYRSLRTFYGSTRWVTVIKLWFLFIAYSIVFTLSALLVIIVSALMI